MLKLKKYFKLKIEKIIYKRISPFIGKILDRLFFTSFSRVGVNFYHHYNRNDYNIDNIEKICFVHLPKTGGITVWDTLKKINFPLYNFPKHSMHNPVSLQSGVKNFKYITVMRNPLDRVYSQFFLYKRLNEKITSHGLTQTLRTQISFKNLACQYYSGLIDENIDERIFDLAKKNLDNFFFIINFDNFELDLKNLIKKAGLNNEVNIQHKNKSIYEKINKTDKEIIGAYNFWDIKLFEYYEKNLKSKF